MGGTGYLRYRLPPWLGSGHRPVGYVSGSREPCGSSGAGGLASGGDHHPGVRYARDDSAPRPHPSLVLRRDPRFNDGDLLR